MSKPVITVSPDLDIRCCARRCARFELSRAPELEHDEVIGSVGLTAFVIEGMARQAG